MHVVLFEPEIAANTGNIARLCAATGSSLHLIRPLGFFLTDPRLKRAGLDYWDYLDLYLHDSYPDFVDKVKPRRFFFVETGGSSLYSDIAYETDDYFIFGSETKGLPAQLLSDREKIVTLPQSKVRSLNLSNAVAIVIYEAWRQHNFQGMKDFF